MGSSPFIRTKEKPRKVKALRGFSFVHKGRTRLPRPSFRLFPREKLGIGAQNFLQKGLDKPPPREYTLVVDTHTPQGYTAIRRAVCRRNTMLPV